MFKFWTLTFQNIFENKQRYVTMSGKKDKQSKMLLLEKCLMKPWKFHKREKMMQKHKKKQKKGRKNKKADNSKNSGDD